jgi:FAD/FMN-containing dehydrogenase
VRGYATYNAPAMERAAALSRRSPRRVLRDLSEVVSGDLLFDEATRSRYAEAAGIYRIPPLGVIRPRDAGDVIALCRYAREEGIPLTARGAGSGMPGHNVGAGLIIDFTKYLNRLVAVREASARVEPGIALDALNRRLSATGLHFPPDPGSGAYCTLGGMIATNAAGPRHLVRGATRDHVKRLVVVLPSGDVLDTGSRRSDTLRARSALERIAARHRAALEAEQPRAAKNSSGYDIQGGLTALLVGSEGTLGLVVEAELSLSPRPEHRGVALLGFDSLEAAGRFVVEARRGGARATPSAVEMMDRTLLDAYRAAAVDLPVELPRSLEAVLLVEVEGHAREPVRERLEAVRALGQEAIFVHEALSADQQALLWQVRKAASPVLGQRTDGLRSLQFVEDGAVPPERLPEYVVRLRSVFRRRGVLVAIFGHAGDGHLHVNPLLDPTRTDFRATMRAIADEVNDLVREMGGTPSGEHGDGRARAPYLSRFFPRSLAAFRRVKSWFDPRNILNPGVKLPLPRQSLTSRLRWGRAASNA